MVFKLIFNFLFWKFFFFKKTSQFVLIRLLYSNKLIFLFIFFTLVAAVTIFFDYSYLSGGIDVTHCAEKRIYNSEWWPYSCNNCIVESTPNSFPRCGKTNATPLWHAQRRFACWELCERDMLLDVLKKTKRSAGEGTTLYSSHWLNFFYNYWTHADALYATYDKSYLAEIKAHDMENYRNYLSKCYPDTIEWKKYSNDLDDKNSTFLRIFKTQSMTTFVIVLYIIVPTILFLVYLLTVAPLLLLVVFILAVIVRSVLKGEL